MPKQDKYSYHIRNAAIRQTFYNYLHSGVHRMMAYAKTASEYYISEDRVRDIVANRRI